MRHLPAQPPGGAGGKGGGRLLRPCAPGVTKCLSRDAAFLKKPFSSALWHRWHGQRRRARLTQGSPRPHAAKGLGRASAGRRGAQPWAPIVGSGRPPSPRREPLRLPCLQGAELVSAERSPGCEHRRRRRLSPEARGPRHRASCPAYARVRPRARAATAARGPPARRRSDRHQPAWAEGRCALALSRGAARGPSGCRGGARKAASSGAVRHT